MSLKLVFSALAIALTLPNAYGMTCHIPGNMQGECRTGQDCDSRFGTNYVHAGCEQTFGRGNYCCYGAQQAPVDRPRTISGPACNYNGYQGVCYDRTRCLEFGLSPGFATSCGSQACCLGNNPAPVAPRPSQPTRPTAPSGSCTTFQGESGVCQTVSNCFRTNVNAVAVENDQCKRFNSQAICCVNRGGSVPPPQPPAQPPRPPAVPSGGGDTALSRQGHRGQFQTSCFTRATHVTYKDAAHRPVITYGVTAYVQDDYFQRGKVDRARIMQAIASANQLYAGSGVQFSDVRVAVLPSHLKAPSNDIGYYDQYKEQYKSHATANNPGRITVYFAHFAGTLGGELIGTWPFDTTARFDEPTLFMNVNQFQDNRAPWFRDLVFNHELGHLLGLFHTFQDFRGIDVCNDPWSYDIVPDTSYTPQSSAGCGATAVDPCSGRNVGIDTWNVMSYGSCIGGGDPLTADQFARVRCVAENHLQGLHRIGGRRTVSRAFGGAFVGVSGLGDDVPHAVIDKGNLVVQVGDDVQFNFGRHNLLSPVAYLFPTDVVRIPSEQELSKHRIDAKFSQAGLRDGAVVQVADVHFDARDGQIDRGNYALIVVGKDPTTNQRMVVTTSVFPIDVNSCSTGLDEAGIGLMRSQQVCDQRGGSVVFSNPDNGLVCCAPAPVLSYVRSVPIDRLQRAQPPLMTIKMWGRTFFWGQEIALETAEAPATGAPVELRPMSTARVETQFSTQSFTMPPTTNSRVKVTPHVNRPGTYAFATDQGESTMSFSIVPMPCKMQADNRPGYCLPTRSVGDHRNGATCPGGNTQPCQGLAIGSVKFACCPGSSAYAEDQAGANYRDGAGVLETAASAHTLSAALALAMGVAVLFA